MALERRLRGVCTASTRIRRASKGVERAFRGVEGRESAFLFLYFFKVFAPLDALETPSNALKRPRTPFERPLDAYKRS